MTEEEKVDVEKEERTRKTEVIETKRWSLQWLLKMMAVLVVVFSIALLIFLGVALKWVLIISGILLAIGIISYLIFHFYRKKEEEEKKKDKEEKLPEPAKPEQIWNKVKKCLTNEEFKDHIKENKYKDVRRHPGGREGERIYEFVADALYNDKQVHIIINAHYPDEIPTILFEPSKFELRMAVNSMSTKPKEEPSTEEEVRELPSGERVIRKRRIKKEKPKPEVLKELE